MPSTRALIRSLLEQGFSPSDPAFLATLRAERLKVETVSQPAPLLSAIPSNQQ